MQTSDLGAEWINMDCSTIEEQDDDDEARNYGWIKSDLRGIYLSNQLSEDCNFEWTKVVPADKVFLNPGETVPFPCGRVLCIRQMEKR